MSRCADNVDRISVDMHTLLCAFSMCIRTLQRRETYYWHLLHVPPMVTFIGQNDDTLSFLKGWKFYCYCYLLIFVCDMLFKGDNCKHVAYGYDEYVSF